MQMAALSRASKMRTIRLLDRPGALLVLFAFCLVIVGSRPADAQTAVPPTFVGLHMHAGVIGLQPWPSVSFAATRLWDSGVHWAQINTANGSYHWTDLDKWLAKAKQYNVDVLYTFGRTPQWASSDPNDLNCPDGPGQCDPPNDLNPDGSGTDQHWINFVTAIVKHSNSSTTAHIRYWEIWNEAYNLRNWTGTIAQMVRMSKDAAYVIRSLDPTALVLTPSVDIESTKGRTWFANYLATGVGQYSDVIGFHGYVQKAGYTPVAENLIGYIDQTRTILKTYGQGSKPMWDTEASWGRTVKTDFYNQDLQAAFLARMYLLHRFKGIARFYWYQWNNPDVGTLWLPDPNDPSAPGTLQKPGVAYGQMYRWMVGNTMTGCSVNGTIWTCQFSGPSGYAAEAIWDTSQSCSNGSCTTIGYKVPTQFVRYRTLSGATITISGSMVPIGAKPILVEN